MEDKIKNWLVIGIPAHWETAYATVAGSSEQFYVNYDAKAQT